MTPVVEARGIAKLYGSLVAVDDLTFAVEAGEVLGVLGPNGAGKTTADPRADDDPRAEPRELLASAGIPHTRPEEIRQAHRRAARERAAIPEARPARST